MSKIHFNDTEYPSLKALCKAERRDYRRVQARLRRNWTLEDAIKKPYVGYLRKANKPRDYLGYDSLKALCDARGMDYELVRKRVFQRKWDVERAITTPSRNRSNNKSTDLQAVYYALKGLGDGPHYSTFVKRVRSGMTPEEAFNTPDGRHFAQRR